MGGHRGVENTNVLQRILNEYFEIFSNLVNHRCPAVFVWVGGLSGRESDNNKFGYEV